MHHTKMLQVLVVGYISLRKGLQREWWNILHETRRPLNHVDKVAMRVEPRNDETKTKEKIHCN